MGTAEGAARLIDAAPGAGREVLESPIPSAVSGAGTDGDAGSSGARPAGAPVR
jgi:hypothetical protein